MITICVIFNKGSDCQEQKSNVTPLKSALEIYVDRAQRNYELRADIITKLTYVYSTCSGSNLICWSLYFVQCMELEMWISGYGK